MKTSNSEYKVDKPPAQPPALYKPKARSRAPKLIPASHIKTRRKEWLWNPYIPKYEVTMIFAKGGLGKGHLTSEIVGRLTTGQLLSGEPKGTEREPLTVLMMRVEDDPEDTIVPQLVVAGTDLNKVLLPSAPFVLNEAGIANLDSYIRDYEVNVITIDPIVYYGGGKVNTDKANSVRQILQPLSELARKRKVTIIIVAHARKSGNGSMDDLMGSADYVNAVRSTIALYKDDKTGRLIFKHAKSNKGREGSPWTFTIEDSDVVLDDGSTDTVGHFTFGEKLAETDLVAKRGRPAEARQEAVEFLQTILANGDVEQTVVHAKAQKTNIAPATLDRAKKGVAESYYSKARAMFMWRLVQPTVH